MSNAGLIACARTFRNRAANKGRMTTAARAVELAKAELGRCGHSNFTYYAMRGPATLGAAGERGGRWIESPDMAGLRFVGFSDECGGRSFRRVDHTGWYLSPLDDGDTAWPRLAVDGPAAFLDEYASGRRLL